MVVVFELVPHRENRDRGGVLDLGQRDVAGPSEGDDQVAQERAGARLAAGEGRGLQSVDPAADGGQRLGSEIQITAVASQLALDDEVEQAVEVVPGLTGQPDPVAHRRVFACLARAASSLRCSASTTTSAST